ncbi:MAG TPA: serine/threonine-protein kinase, partial [Gemmataceae bacterium]|nr:serine/threonine-protein kinase [Gemmataceae bacterium]
QQYLELLDKGERPNRADFLRRYPEIAVALEDCLAGLDLVHQAGVADLVAVKARNAAADDAVAGQPLGDFKIVREIGRGGMGIVYEAVQLSLGRRVALKVLPFAATFDAKHLQRFKNEAQAAAHLHHTNIVPVFAVDSERGVHFYAMQLIAGQSLAHVLRQIRKRAGKNIEDDEPLPESGFSTTVQYPADSARSTAAPSLPTESPPNAETMAQFSLTLSEHRTSNRYFRDVAGLAIQAAEALEHAHQYGVIHRDIKPANLLVEPQGRLWVTDFGLAHFRTGTVLTQTGDLMGTLRYMSPEQATGAKVGLDHRTDIYALGATLYELVTLEPIWVGKTRHELLHQILSTEPRAPRSLDRSIPLELETIILKAVAKNPTDRYASAQELAADLRRYLDDKPILAKRPGLIERGRKWARRHPSIVWAAVGLLVLTMAGLAVNNRMIQAEQEKTSKARDREQLRADEAEARFQQARAAVDLLVQVCDEELGNEPSAQAARRRLLQAALGYYQEFLDQSQGRADVQSQLHAVQARVSSILGELTTLQNSVRNMLVLEPDVQDDLGLSPDARTRIEKFDEKWSAERRALFRRPGGPGGPGGPGPRGPSESERKKFVEMARANERDLKTVLTVSQLGRLEQIDLQLAGPKIFFESKVIDALHLTSDQRRKIREIEASAFAEFHPEPGGPRPGQFDDAKRLGVERILDVLSAPQKRQWHELVGEPFHGEVHVFREGFGGPGGPGGPGGGPPKKGPRDGS